MLKLRYVHIHRYRSVSPDTRLEFGEGPHFIVGKNGSGKTTLLELIAALSTGQLESFGSETQPMDVEWQLERRLTDPYVGGPGLYSVTLRLTVEPFDESSLRSSPTLGVKGRLLTKPIFSVGPVGPTWKLEGRVDVRSGTESPIEPNATEGAAEDSAWLSFALDSNDQPRSRPSVPGTAALEFHMFSPFAEGALYRLAFYLDGRTYGDYFVDPDELETDQERRLALLMVLPEPVKPRRYDEALETFQDIVAPEREHGTKLSFWMISDRHVEHRLIPLWMAFELKDQQTDHPMVEVLKDGEHEQEDQTSLREAVRSLGAEAVQVRPRFESRTPEDVWTFRGFDLDIVWPNSKTSYRALSFGQKRILAFAWYLDVFADYPFVTDELSNGLHSDWVHDVLRWMEEHQGFHAAQNPLLIDAAGVGEDEDVTRTRFIFCSSDGDGCHRSFAWRNPTVTETRRLREAWDTGFQQLSEILMSEGLW